MPFSSTRLTLHFCSLPQHTTSLPFLLYFLVLLLSSCSLTPTLCFLSLSHTTMPPNCPNLHNAERPDFTTDEYKDACISLINTGVPAGTTAITLAQIWTFNNERDKAEWDRAVADEAQAEEAARQLATAAEELLCQQELVEKEATLSEERKKTQKQIRAGPHS